MMRRALSWSRLALCLAALLWAGAAAPASTPAVASATPALVLHDHPDGLDAWPFLTVWSDRSGRAGIEQVLNAPRSGPARPAPRGGSGKEAEPHLLEGEPPVFAPPAVPRNAFPPGEGALWLRLPLQVPAGDTRPWVLSIDYTELLAIDYHLVQWSTPCGAYGPADLPAWQGANHSDTKWYREDLQRRHAGKDAAHKCRMASTTAPLQAGRVIDRQALGQRVVFTQRTLPTSRHAVRLAVQPGGSYEVLLRVQTVGEVLVPLRLLREPQLQAREDRLQLAMGLMLGATLALLAYCLLYGLHLREPLFLLYAAQLVSLGGYLAASRGVLGQYLWPDDPWWTINGAGFLLALALASACAFIDRVLHVAALRPWCSRVLRTVAAAGVGMAVLLWLGWLDLAMMNDIFSVLGATPVVLGAWCAWLRWRQGDRVAGWIFIERVAQSCGVLTLASLVQGLLPATPFTLDLFLWTCTLEMGIWVWALGTRARMLIDAEQRARADQAHLQSLAHSDALTGVLNRHGMHEALAQALAAARPERLLAVFVLDLNGFKAVNDTYGHAAGDALLVAVAQRLRDGLRQDDIVARLGGDEFVIAAQDLPHAAAAARIGRVVQQQFDTPFACGPAQCRLGVTVGYALAPEDAGDVESLLAAADQAMYAGKRSGASLRAGPAQRLQRGRLAERMAQPVPRD
jgi:diguanylate cyclase (GGDEF)-like protein